jgi:hypothetical protein
MSIQQEVAKWQDVAFDFSIEGGGLSIPPDVNKAMLHNFKTSDSNKSKINDIITKISNRICNPKYMLPVLSETKTGYEEITYTYSELLQIVKEGYYINKAIAELIHFFQTKKNYEEPIVHENDNNIYITTQPSGVINANTEKQKKCKKMDSTIHTKKQNVTAYPFEGNFDFANYNKFSAKFHVNPSNKDETISKYDTSLVQTIYNEFGDDNVKHIMFACVRNLDQVDKIIGAISTLYLVQDLKST